MIKPSNTTIALSIMYLLILSCLIFFAFIIDNIFMKTGFVVLALLMVLFSGFNTPISVISNSKEIKVKYLIGSTTFQKENYDIIEIDKSDLGPTLRTFGSGGFGGFWGWFISSKIGKFYASYLNGKNLLLLRNKETNRQYVIDRPDSNN